MEKPKNKQESQYICWFSEARAQDSALVGGKNSSLAKMIGGLSDRGIRTPNGYASTSKAYQDFLEQNELTDIISS
ncbi:MAG: PEP/pyruvate-binding domain-containing protein, partial [Bacteriovoracaceae bacterium]